MRTRRLIAAFCVAALSLSLAGCTTAPSNTPASTSGADKTTAAKATDAQATDAPAGEHLTLTVLTNRTDRVEDGSLDDMTEAFEKANNCTVEYKGYTNYTDDVSIMMSTKEYGDVLMIPDTIKLSDLHNYFEPLGSYKDLDAKYNWADKKMFDQQVYGLAHLGAVQAGIAYNKRVWADAGVTETPKTPEAFIAGLEAIRDNVPDCIPYYTNYSSAWVVPQWTGLVMSASGDPNYENDIMISGKPLFEEGGAYYNVFKLMFDVFADKSLHELDPLTADWEASKVAINNGQIGAMVMGSWAVSQFQEAGGNPDDIGYMPPPFTVNGKQYAQSAADYSLAVNINRSAEIRELGKKYIFWFIEESGFAQKEGGLPTLKGGEMPAYLEAFSDVELFVAETAPEELTGVWDEISKGSEVDPWSDSSSNFKFKILETALAGGTFDDVLEIYAGLNQQWETARNANEKIIAYTS